MQINVPKMFELDTDSRAASDYLHLKRESVRYGEKGA